MTKPISNEQINVFAKIAPKTERGKHAIVNDDNLTVQELMTRYAAIRRRLYGGVIGPTGVIPPKARADVAPAEPPSYSYFRFAAPKRFVNLIIQVACDHKIAPEVIVDKSRKAPVVRARQDLFYRASTQENMTASQIGRYFGCDHTTVLHGVKQHEKLLQDGGPSDTL